MFSNGIISFQDPSQSGLSWSNLSVQGFSANMGSQFNYSIFPLWTDLINIVGTFQTEGNTNFQRYNWLGISPFYDSTRLNTFSVEIRPDGSIRSNYTLIDVDYASVGIVGNSGAEEYEQIYFSMSPTNTGSLSNWERYTFGVQDPIEEPKQEFKLVTETPAVIVIETNTGVEAMPIVQSQQSSSEQNSSLDQSQTSGSGISVASILRIVSREQARIGAVERSTVESSAEQSTSQANQAMQEAESIAENSQSDSVSVSVSIQQEQAGGTGLNFLPSTSQLFSASPLGSSSRSDLQTDTVQTEETKNESVSVSGFSAVDLLKEETNVSMDEAANEQRSQSVRRDVSNNELAGGVTLASLSTQPRGFEAYSLTMPDGQFYAPREIYRGQRNVDNARALRGLGTDRLHQDMVDQQYNRGAR